MSIKKIIENTTFTWEDPAVFQPRGSKVSYKLARLVKVSKGVSGQRVQVITIRAEYLSSFCDFLKDVVKRIEEET